MTLLLAATLLVPHAIQDPTPDDPTRFEVVMLEVAAANDALAVLSELVPEAKVMVDPRTNSLLLYAEEDDMVRLKEAIVHLDQDAGQDPDDLFPQPSDDLVIAVGEGGASWTMMDLVQDYARLTAQHVQVDEDTRSYLENTQTGLTRSVVVPKAEVQSFFEGLMYEGSFVLTILREDEPRLLRVTSLNTGHRNTVRAKAHFVPVHQLERWADHPSLMITTVVNLPNVDVRQLSNSMRTMITDANTQQMLPAGNTNSMLLTGFTGSVISLVEMLEIVNEASGKENVNPLFQRFSLANASAAEVAPQIEELVSAAYHSAANVQSAQGVMGTSEHKDVRIVADIRTNALVVMCMPYDLAKVEELVKLFDVEVQ